MMENRLPSRDRFVAPFIWFVLTTLIAIVLLITALLVWLSDLTGSFILSALIVGGFFALIACMIYLLSVRDTIEQIRTELETVYDVARTAKMGYEWVMDKVGLFLQLRDTLRNK